MAAKSVGLGFFVLMSVGVFYTLQTTCPPNWLAWSGSCYTMLRQQMNWVDGRKACERRGGILMIPNSQEEHDFIWRAMKEHMGGLGINERDFQLWIGCREMNEILTCLGEDGYHGYTNWAIGEPNRQNSNCVRMAKTFDGKWGDISCSNEYYATCEMRAPPRRSYCLQADSSGRFTSQCLLNHVIKNVTTTGIIGCGQACWAEPRCHSYNIVGQDAKMSVCQLNDATRYGAHVTDFSHVDNCIHFDL